MNAPHPISRAIAHAEARELYRRARIVTSDELLAAVNNLIASIELPDTAMETCKQQLVDAACDLDGAISYTPEIQGFDKRGEYDSRTKGVKR